MKKLGHKIIIFSFSLFLMSCLGTGMSFTDFQQRCENGLTDFDSCTSELGSYEEILIITDSFERDIVAPEGTDLESMWWRTVINDRGKIFDGLPATHVDAAIFTSAEMGPAASGDRALYFYGREGSSVHNIHLISQEFNLSEFKSVELTFSYLAVNLDPDDYLRVEVCNDTADNCGVGDTIQLSRFDSSSWVILYEMGGEGQGRNGKNHTDSDWETASVKLNLDSLETDSLVVRFNVRVDEGFIKNEYGGKMEDGVALDDVILRATTETLKGPVF